MKKSYSMSKTTCHVFINSEHTQSFHQKIVDKPAGMIIMPRVPDWLTTIFNY